MDRLVDERSVLLAHIASLVEDLERASRALDTPQVDSTLRQAARGVFHSRLERREKELKRLEEDVHHGLSLSDCWQKLRTVRRSCRPILRECLAFLEGDLLRSAGLDEGICEVADALLAELSDRTLIPWQRFTILAEDEFFTDMADIIRIRFPDFSVWSLPVAAHEFGHFVAQELEDRDSHPRRYPFQEFLRREVDPQAARHLHEHFADLFAVYALGPAYACTCTLLRFDPGMAFTDGKDGHPSDGKRVYVILRALDVLDESKTGFGSSYQGIIETLRSPWVSVLEQLDRAITLQLDEWLWRLYAMLDGYLPDVVRYGGWDRAVELSADLLSNKDPAHLLQDDHTLVDVLNAAWLCRIKHWNRGTGAERRRAQRISRRGVALCRAIMERT